MIRKHEITELEGEAIEEANRCFQKIDREKGITAARQLSTHYTDTFLQLMEEHGIGPATAATQKHMTSTLLGIIESRYKGYGRMSFLIHMMKTLDTLMLQETMAQRNKK